MSGGRAFFCALAAARPSPNPGALMEPLTVSSLKSTLQKITLFGGALAKFTKTTLDGRRA